MKKPYLLIVLLVALPPLAGLPQQHHLQPPAALTFNPVLSQKLSGSELQSYRIDSSVMIIQAGAQDTVSHRHDCELFGYVLYGEVQIGLSNEKPQVFKQGEMFYEKRNVLHYLTANNLQNSETRVLLIFLVEEGRQTYKLEYSENHIKK